MLSQLWPLAAGVALVTAPLTAQVPPGSLELVSADGTSRVISAQDLAALPHAEVSVAEAQGTGIYRGPALRDVLTLAGAPAGRALRGPAMALVVLAEASDSYVAAFTVSEVDPQFGARTAVIAITRNGVPLVDRDGPLRIVVPDDEFHARWVRHLVTLRLVQLEGGSVDNVNDE
jgi:hypothetical protein